jgi:four helix bundle protein
MEMTTMKPPKKYDLEERTLLFAKNVRILMKRIPASMVNRESITQLLRSSGSVGANYIEANESLGKKDFIMRIRICLKEAKESAYWLQLLEVAFSTSIQRERDLLEEEARSFQRIFGAILKKVQT